ncbi:MAG: DJ-1/PfpI family protein [Planctomycetes bacterium]|nr:DJ-1/PfpI family protein [Planctomycetota bacterium]
MKRANRAGRWILCIAMLSSCAIDTGAAADEPRIAPAKKYVCPPCDDNCHDKTFDEPGRCPVCNMRLKVMDPVRNVAILVWEGVEVLDFAGPAEVFAATRAFGESPFNVYLVSPTAGPVTSQGFIKLTANYTIDDCPTPDVMVIPGGGTGALLGDGKVLQWVKSVSLDAEMTMSVCTGAMVLAKCGILDDISATTWHGAIDNLKAAAPNTTVFSARRIVDSGDIITTAGVSAGIDGALHVVKGMLGEDIARKTAKYMEYEWIPEFDFGFVDYVRDTGINARTQPFVDSIIEGIEIRIYSGRFLASDVLCDPRWMFIHEQPKFREMMKKHLSAASATLLPPEEPGERLMVTGTVKDEEGKPVANATVYVFHTGNDGRYSKADGNFGSMGDSLNPRLFAYLKTGADGHYDYRTIKPGHYPQSGPPAHVHYAVTAEGFEELVTELMFEGDERLTPGAITEFEKAGFVIANLERDGDGSKCVCDLTLKKK